MALCPSLLRLLLMALLILLAACATDRSAFQSVSDEMLADAASGALAHNRARRQHAFVVPKGIAQELLADDAAVSAAMQPRRRFDLRVSDVAARTFFASVVSDDSRVNMIIPFSI